MIGAGVLNRLAKSMSGPCVVLGSGRVGAFSIVGDEGFEDRDSVEETERRFVRAGVRTVDIGGA